MTSFAILMVVWVGLFRVRRSSTLLIFFNLPSTFLHEFSHWLVAFLTASSPGFPSVWPRRSPGGWQLGSVRFRPKAWTAGWVALAPLALLGPLSAWGLVLWEPKTLTQAGLGGVFFAYTAWGSIPSMADWVIALKYPLGTIQVLTLLAMVAGIFSGA